MELLRAQREVSSINTSCIHEYDFLDWFVKDVLATKAVGQNMMIKDVYGKIDLEMVDIFINYMCNDPKKTNMLSTAHIF